jgi:ribosomal protein S18 acetylase RimI-like enzyme
MDLQLAERVHENLMTVNGWMGQGPGRNRYLDGGDLLIASRSPFPFLNCALRKRSGDDAEEFLSRARSFFFERRRGFVAYAWPGDHAVENAARAAGMLPVVDRYPEMVCRTPLDPLPGDIRPVETPVDAQAYWTVCDAAYPSLGFPPGLFDEAFEPTDLLDPQRVWACVAYDDDRPLACASAWMAGGVGMIGWVASSPEARGRGLAAACTICATNHLLGHGCEIASLQASSMGDEVYRRLGYEEIFSYRLFGAMPE